jgi:hypothetical protein
MQISETMLARAAKLAPQLDADGLQRLLRGLMVDGQLVFKEGEGKTMSEGKVHFPVQLQLIIEDPALALDLAAQLMAGAKRALEGDDKRTRVTLSLAGDAMVCE